VIQAPGKIQRIDLAGDRLSVDGKFAIARSTGLQYEVQRAARSILGSLTSGEGVLSIFEGTGTVLIAPVPNLYQNLVSLIEGKLPKGK
jgi:uncharacterized protein (AIM24 family)